MTYPIPTIESFTVEFKSDRKHLSNVELAEAVICLANAEGDELWLDLENDGTLVCLYREHQMLAACDSTIKD